MKTPFVVRLTRDDCFHGPQLRLSSAASVRCKTFLTILGLSLLALASAFGSTTVTVVWNPNLEPDIVSYRIYYGVASRTYTNKVSVGNVTTGQVPGLLAGVKYYLAVSALNSSGMESDYSAEVSYLVPSLNQLPTISSIPSQVTSEDVGISVSLVVGDKETPASSLTLSASSSNPQLVPVNSILFGGSGSNRTATITPAPYKSGTTTVTLFVSDGTQTNSSSFLLTVNPVNNPPRITAVPDQVINEDTATAPIPFTITDVDNSISNLVVNVSTSDPVLVPSSGIILGGSGTNRTLTLRPAKDGFGTTTIDLSVTDGSLTTTTSFLLTVNPVNDAPTMSAFSDVTIAKGATFGPVPLVIGDAETPPENLTVVGFSSNPYLVPDYRITFSGTGSDRTLTVTPFRRRTGTAVITVQVSDGVLVTSNSFLLTVGTGALSGGTTFSDAQILAADLYGSSLTVSWATKAGGVYRLLGTTNLVRPVWSAVAPDVKAAGVVSSWIGATTNAPSRFFRVQKIQ